MTYRFFRLALLVFSAVMTAFVSAPPNGQAGEERPAALSQSDWDRLVAAARKEGAVTIYGTAIQPVMVPLRTAFKSAYGIDLEFVEGRPAEVGAKLQSERRAGLYLADVGHLGETTSTMDIKPTGVTQPLPNLLVAPEVKNPRAWINGRLPFLDRDSHVLLFTAMAIPHGIANSELVKDSEMVSFPDVLAPKWKGKIVFSDPTISGTSPNEMAALYKHYGEEKAMAMFRKLAALEPMFTRDQRLLMEWVARGKYLIGLGQSMALFAEFKRFKAPAKVLNLQEPRLISGGPGNLIVFNNNPHPKATQLYINWLLSKEGLAIWSKSMGYPTMRLDVGQEGLDPVTVPRGTDVFPDEEHLKLRVKMRNIAVDIFGPLMK